MKFDFPEDKALLTQCLGCPVVSFLVLLTFLTRVDGPRTVVVGLKGPLVPAFVPLATTAIPYAPRLIASVVVRGRCASTTCFKVEQLQTCMGES